MLSTLLTLTLTLKVQQQVSSNKSLVRCALDAYSLNGIRTFYRGYLTLLCCESFGRGVYMYTYELGRQLDRNSLPVQIASAGKRLFTPTSPHPPVLPSVLPAVAITDTYNPSCNVNYPCKPYHSLGRHILVGCHISVGRGKEQGAAGQPVAPVQRRPRLCAQDL